MCVSVHECYATSSFSPQYLQNYIISSAVSILFLSSNPWQSSLPLILEMSLLTHADECVRFTVSINSNDNTMRFVLLSHTFHKGRNCVARMLNLLAKITFPRFPLNVWLVCCIFSHRTLLCFFRWSTYYAFSF